MEEQDDEVRMAIAALGSLRGSTVPAAEGPGAGAGAAEDESVEGEHPTPPGRSATRLPPPAKHGHEITLPPISSLLEEERGGISSRSSSSSLAQDHPANHHQDHYHPSDAHRRYQQHQPHHQHYYTVAAESGSSTENGNGILPGYRRGPGQHGTAGAGEPSSGSASTSNSALTFSPATTPSARTATDYSSPNSPTSLKAASQTYFQSHHSSHPPHPEDLQHGSSISRANSGPLQDELEGLALSGPELGDDGFIGRVSQLPYVSGALKVYERGRNSSRVVKYGTDLMESSVKTLSKPVINRVVGPSLAGQLDDFACRQLDRVGFGPTREQLKSDDQSSGRTPQSVNEALPPETSSSSSSHFSHTDAYYRRAHGTGRTLPDDAEFDPEDAALSPASEAPTVESHHSYASSSPYPTGTQYPLQQQLVRSSPAPRSRWQSLVIEAGVTAGGIGAAVSEESMKSLKYCLHWLHYATAHLDHQIGILREFILSLTHNHRNASAAALTTSENARAADILDGIKRDVVETIRKVVDVVSTYAGAALPEQAKRYVRSSILGLPEKWARAMQQQQEHRATSVEDVPQESQAGTSLDAGDDPESTSTGHGARPMNAVEAGAERTLAFAVESLDMLRGVLGIFNESVERADAWVERLRIIGLQRQQALSAQNRQQRHGYPQHLLQRRSAPDSPGAGAISSGVKRREEAIDDSPAFQRRKNSRTSGLRETSFHEDEEELRVDGREHDTEAMAVDG